MSDYNPTVIIPGIGQSKVDMTDAKGNKVKSAWPVDFDIKGALDDLKGVLMKMMLFRKDSGFSDKVAGMAKEAVDPLAVNADGSSKNRLRVVSYPQSVRDCTPDERRYIYRMVPMEDLGKVTGEDKLYFYAFNPFGEVYDTADGLDEYIQLVKSQTGCEKVNLIAVSLGGVVLRAYLDKYAAKNDVEKIVGIVAALDGTYTVSDVYKDALYLENPAQYASLAGSRAEKIAPLLKTVPADVLDKTIDKCYKVLKESIINNCSMMWGLIPNKEFDGIFAKYSSTMDPVLKEKVLRLHNYSLTFGDTLKKMKADGIEICLVCGYGKKLLPVLHSKDAESDSIINIESASMGAVNNNGKIDLANAVLPENTWFFGDQRHDDIAYNTVALDIVKKFITGELKDVDQDEAYPQFNGCRNVFAIKYRRFPEMRRVKEDPATPDSVKEQLDALTAKYYKICENTIIKDNADIDALNAEFKAILDPLKK